MSSGTVKISMKVNYGWAKPYYIKVISISNMIWDGLPLNIMRNKGKLKARQSILLGAIINRHSQDVKTVTVLERFAIIIALEGVFKIIVLILRVVVKTSS